jgi:hypothetical protein
LKRGYCTDQYKEDNWSVDKDKTQRTKETRDEGKEEKIKNSDKFIIKWKSVSPLTRPVSRHMMMRGMMMSSQFNRRCSIGSHSHIWRPVIIIEGNVEGRWREIKRSCLHWKREVNHVVVLSFDSTVTSELSRVDSKFGQKHLFFPKTQSSLERGTRFW